MNRFSIKLLACVYLALLVTVVCWQCSNKSSHKEAISELQIGSGMGHDLMNNQVGHGAVDKDVLKLLIEEAMGQREWRSGPTLKVVVGCTAEDIFGSREAYLSFFESNEGEM